MVRHAIRRVSRQCEAIVPPGTYRSEGQCFQRVNVRPYRWALSELTTKIRELCRAHVALVERKGDVLTVKDATWKKKLKEEKESLAHGF